MDSVSDDRAGSIVAPLLRELDRIAGAVESRRAAEDEARIEALTREVTALRVAVAHLRAAARPLPTHLRPVVARAGLAVQQDGA